MLTEDLKSYLASINATQLPSFYVRNLLKEYLQILVLDIIYKSSLFKQLIFYGGTCLRHCFGLQRLSEDLDFEFLNGLFPFEDLRNELEASFIKAMGSNVLIIQKQKSRLNLKFPVLRTLGIAGASESNTLNVKVEVNQTIRSENCYQTELHPIFKFNKSFIVTRYDLPTLMASKINAILNRSWSKKDKIGKVICDFKGRDYYDLLWYMSKSIHPKLKFTGFGSSRDLWMAVREKVNNADPSSIKNDLISLVEDPRVAEDTAVNFAGAFEAMLKNYGEG